MQKFKRYVVFLVGLFINSMGVSLITKASLGTSPISSIPYVLSLNFSLTLGEFTIIFSLLLIALQLAILGRSFKAENLLQIPISVLFGYFIDITMVMFSFVDTDMYLLKIVYLLAGCVILGFGVYTEVLADVAMLPGESFVRAIVYRWKTDFGITKIIFDLSMTVTAALLSFVFVHRLEGVREGTIIAAVLVGFVARLFGRLFVGMPQLLFGTRQEAEQIEQGGAASTDFPVIVIGRQYGCGGHGIGKALAQRLSYAFYDKEIIQLAAGSTGYTPDFIKQKEESMANGIIYDLVNQMYVYSSEHEAPKDSIFEAEAKVINELADKGGCVIIGRCSDYILRNNPNCLRVFLYAPADYRVRHIMSSQGVSESNARLKIQQEDKRRADNYRYYTRRMWGQAQNYHICVDTSLGEDYTIKLIEAALDRLKAK